MRELAAALVEDDNLSVDRVDDIERDVPCRDPGVLEELAWLGLGLGLG